MILSPNFTLAELVLSETAVRHGIDNTPPPAIVERLKATARGLEAVRTRLGALPLLITSGYRCLRLNRLLRSKDCSQHVLGEAADFICPRFGTPLAVAAALRDSEIAYDQMILEFGRWVHISFRELGRREALIIDHGGAKPMLT